MRKNHFLPALGGLLLCVVTLAFSIALQQAGYCTYLNSDMSSELILAKQQHDSGSLIDFDWLYSTEIHTLHMNLLYALAFCFTSSYKIARIIGNTLGFVISMSVLYALLRKLRISSGKALAVTALLPFSASALYASNMTIGGYYIVHLPFAYGLFILWNNASERKNRYRFIPLCTLCFLMGFLSVRYVLCFICPLFISGVFRMFDKKDKKTVFPPVTQASVLGFFFCCAGYIAAEIVTPRLFHSGTGSASSFFSIRWTAV